MATFAMSVGWQHDLPSETWTWRISGGTGKFVGTTGGEARISDLHWLAARSGRGQRCLEALTATDLMMPSAVGQGEEVRQ